MLCLRGRRGTSRERMKTALCIVKGSVLLVGLRSHDDGAGEEQSVKGGRRATRIAYKCETKRDQAGGGGSQEKSLSFSEGGMSKQAAKHQASEKRDEAKKEALMLSVGLYAFSHW
jgi:hypothetical protein